jgi:hypothetical protein
MGDPLLTAPRNSPWKASAWSENHLASITLNSSIDPKKEGIPN